MEDHTVKEASSGLCIAQRFRTMGARYGKTPARAAIAWAPTPPGVVCALTGPSTLPPLEENLGGSGWTPSEEDLAALERFFGEEGARLRREQIASEESRSQIPLWALEPDKSSPVPRMWYAPLNGATQF